MVLFLVGGACGAFVGLLLGMVLASLMFASADASRAEERRLNERIGDGSYER